MGKNITAPMLYAWSQGIECVGLEECYWCKSPCGRSDLHDDPPPVPFRKVTRLCKKPSSPWICRGCWLFRRQRITVPFLTEGYRDGQSPMKNSWWITDKGAWAIRSEDRQGLYRLLLNPPGTFALSLLADNELNHLQLMEVNDVNMPLKGETLLKFTLNNVLHTYCPYDLDTVIKTKGAGKEPGVRALLNWLGPYQMSKEELAEQKEREERQAGRPKVAKSPKERI